MSFTFQASKQPAITTCATNSPSTTFTFGATGAGDAGKPTGFLQTSTPVQNKPGSMFGTGLSTTTAQGTGFGFGTPPVAPSIATTQQTPGLTFGTGTVASTGITPGATSTVAPTGFSAATPAGSTLGFSLGSSTAATTAAVPTSGFVAKPLTSGFSLGGGEATSSAGTTGLTFGTPNTMTTGTGFTLGAASTATTTSTTTTSATGFSLNTTGTTSAATGFSLNKTSAAPSLTTSSAQLSLGTTTTVSSSASANPPASINSFEESINKWTLELEEQEKVFVNQAAQVNAWDKLLISNGEKIVALNQEVERVKIEQQQLEHELDYVVGQQKELEDFLVPLEKELASLPVSDPEREYTYRLAEDLDTQLKRMSEDLKEIIEHLNQANRTQDSSDPIVQIGKILNAHMNSLQWLHQQTSLLNQKIQQIDQLHQNIKQENEQSFNLAYK
ncbi:nucleoporin 62 [Colletes latitarsis]|uniref:nucleoporin 62 n=1 Tax=Colletes latitarsis TaxID=2605962 RepID=UPI0040362250